MLPPQYTQTLGNINLPHEDGKFITTKMQQDTIMVGSDGLVKDNTATFGFVIMPNKETKMDKRTRIR